MVNSDKVKWKYGAWAEVAEKNDWAKLYKARDRGILGCLGDSWHEYDLRQLCSFDLSCKMGVKQTWKDMFHSYMLLRLAIKRIGVDMDAVCVPEYTPIHHLPHFHGIMRWNNWNRSNKYFISQKELSVYWEKFQGAFRVYIEQCSDLKMAERKINYAVKDERIIMVSHAVKEYPDSSKMGLRISTTHGWKPENTEIVHKIIKKAANRVLNDGRHYEISDRKEIWNKVDLGFRNWARGLATFPMRIYDYEVFFIQNQSVMLLNGGVYGIEDYGIKLGIIKEKKEKK